jgi:hypothetical protein
MAAFRQDGIREHTHHANTGTTIDEVDMPVDQSARQVFGCLVSLDRGANPHSTHIPLRWASGDAPRGWIRWYQVGRRRTAHRGSHGLVGRGMAFACTSFRGPLAQRASASSSDHRRPRSGRRKPHAVIQDLTPGRGVSS